MARVHSRRGSAHGTPTSLTTLLSPTTTLTRPSAVTSTLTMLHELADQPEPLRLISDRREYHPAKKIMRPPGALIRSATQLVHSTQSIRSPLQFRAPNLISICLRRKVRKEVLHALNRTRKGKGGSRRRNQWSKIKC